MKYNILEARIEFQDNQISRITVLVDMSIKPGRSWDFRAIFATTRFNGSGYMRIPPGAKLSEELLQKVAGTGMETVDKDELFKGWSKKYLK